MVGRSVDKKDEIRAYIKARSKLGCSLKKLMTEISTAFGPSCVSYDTVRRWKKKFESGVESIKNAPKSGRPKSASRKEIVSKIKEIIEDARFTVRDIARKGGISLSTVHLSLKEHLKVRKISTRWVPHLLTDEQKRQRVKVAKKLLQVYPKYDKKQFANVVTGDETWVYYFEPVRKVSNKIWATKHSKRPIIAKRSLSTKVLYAIFFSGEGVAIKMPVKKGKSITGEYYKDVVLKKLKKYYQKRRPVTGFKHVRLLHDNAPAHTSAIVTAFLKKEKVTVFPHPPPPQTPPPHPRIPQTLPHVISFGFRNWKHSLLGGNSSPDGHLDLPFISTLLLCPNQRTVTPSRSGYIGWNFAFLATGSTSRAWNEYFWANLKFEVSR